MNINICDKCKHKSKVETHTMTVCGMCENNPFVISDKFEPREVEIVPQKAGELWQQDRGYTVFTFNGIDGPKVINENGTQQYVAECDLMIHGKNGWTRRHPPVERKLLESHIVYPQERVDTPNFSVNSNYRETVLVEVYEDKS